MSERTRPRKFVAVYEAGHAVACWALQRQLGFHWNQFHSVLIRSIEEIQAGPYRDDRDRENNCAGILNVTSRYVPLGAESRRQLEELHGADEIRALMEADAMQALAGPAAEARYRRYSAAYILMTCGADDWAAAEKLARDFIEHESELGRVVDTLYKRATRLVCQPAHWKAVLAVADALLERWTLTADEAVALMEDADRDG